MFCGQTTTTARKTTRATATAWAGTAGRTTWRRASCPPPRPTVHQARESQIMNKIMNKMTSHCYCTKTAQHLDSSHGCYRIPARLVPGVPTRTRLQSSMKKANPHVMYAHQAYPPRRYSPRATAGSRASRSTGMSSLACGWVVRACDLLSFYVYVSLSVWVCGWCVRVTCCRSTGMSALACG